MNRIFLLFSALLFSVFSSAQVYDMVVAKDGTGDYATVQEAINAAATGTTRTTIFIKKGVYNEKVYIGSHTVKVSKVLSLIGENRDSVIITWDDYNGISKTYYTGTSNVTYGTPQSATLTINASDDFYMENVTVKNTYTAAQAVAVYNYSDRQTFKNCRFVGFQDTHYLKKGRRTFFYNTQIEGGTDFICSGGTAYFYQCKIKSLTGGQYITAPEDITYSATISTGKTLYYGFIFKDCDLINDGVLSDASVYLGRPWQGTSGSLFLNCRLGDHIKPAGWSVWGSTTNHETSFFGEYQSMNAAGSALADVSNRVSWSYQLSLADVNNFLLLQKIYAAVTTSTTFDPVSMVIAPTPVAAVVKDGQSLTWDAVSDVKGYVVYADGSALGFTTSPIFSDTAVHTVTPVYTVRSVGANGNLSLTDGSVDEVTAVSINAAINTTITSITSPKVTVPTPVVQNGLLQFDQPTDFTLFSVSGQILMTCQQRSTCNLSALPPGTYLIQATDAVNGSYRTKIIR
jgi:pectinesterase